MSRLEPSRVEELVGQARLGSHDALGQALEAYRAYLLVVASEALDSGLRGKIGASDLVQEAFLEAHRDFATFRGRTEEELRAWLRRILLNNVANFSRQYQETEKRQVAREVSLDQSSRQELKASLPTDTCSPSEEAIRHERLQRVEQAIEELPSPLREVIRWRNLELLPFAEIGRRMNRTEKAVQKLWVRALHELEKRLASTE